MRTVLPFIPLTVLSIVSASVRPDTEWFFVRKNTVVDVLLRVDIAGSLSLVLCILVCIKLGDGFACSMSLSAWLN